MVALKHGLPLIQNEQGVAVTFENDWLKAALDRAARRAGYETWWLLDEFSAAVSQYLRQDYHATVIELTSLDRVVRATLRDIGYREIAAKFRTVNPFQSVSLSDCVRGARETGNPRSFGACLSASLPCTPPGCSIFIFMICTHAPSCF